jgi:hypothetical protein
MGAPSGKIVAKELHLQVQTVDVPAADVQVVQATTVDRKFVPTSSPRKKAKYTFNKGGFEEPTVSLGPSKGGGGAADTVSDCLIVDNDEDTELF